ncbi:MAG: DNA/RNA nuclease SfsA [Idiomarina sp.]|nr:DNA/RNA nuclease SfsA [Idiomarina sp.]
MQFEPPLKPAVLIRRYKRFLADVTTPDGHTLTIHCPNTGAMTGCAEPGATIWYSTSTSKTRKYPHTWELTQTPKDWICVNTHRANLLVEQAISEMPPPSLTEYHNCQREIRYGDKSRIDLLFTSTHEPDCYVEVKSVTLLEAGQGYFPDTVSVRGARQLTEMTQLLAQGHRAMVVYAVLHTGIDSVKCATHIDPQYCHAIQVARNAGLEIMEAHYELSEKGVKFLHWRS